MTEEVEPPEAGARPSPPAIVQKHLVIRILLGLVVLATFVAPHVSRLRHPSLYGDDVMRIWQLQTLPLQGQLLRPFNEHFAPLFDLVSWTVWHSSGMKLTLAPGSFTWAAVIPFVLSLAAIRVFVRRELGSTAAAVALILFGLSPLHQIETVWWYSGSNHMWALFFSVAAMDATRRRGPASAVVSVLSTCFAPMCSAMGFVGGPAAIILTTTGPSDPARPRAKWRAAGPVLGLLLFALGSSAFQYGKVIADSTRVNLNTIPGVLLAIRAPVDALIPAAIGLKDFDQQLPSGADVALGALLPIACILWTLPNRKRSLLLAGLWLIYGTYLLIYPFRSIDGPYWGLRVARYHVFPQFGLSLLVAGSLAPWLQSLDPRPRTRSAFAAALALICLFLQWPNYTRAQDLYRFEDQSAILAALEHVAEIGRSRGISREQALLALVPTQTRWASLEGWPVQRLLPKMAANSHVPDSEVKAALLDALSPSEREALSSGMDAGLYLVPTPAIANLETLFKGRQVGSEGLILERPPQVYRTEGWPSFVEYEMLPMTSLPGEALFLCVTARDVNQGVEVWWTSEGHKWTPLRRIRWQSDPTRTGIVEWALPLDKLPNWQASRVKRIRLYFRFAGHVTIGEPRILGTLTNPVSNTSSKTISD